MNKICYFVDRIMNRYFYVRLLFVHVVTVLCITSGYIGICYNGDRRYQLFMKK